MIRGRSPRALSPGPLAVPGRVALRMFWVENRKAFQGRHLAEDFVGGDEMTYETLALQPERDGDLYGVECPKPPLERVLFQQTLGLRKRCLVDGEDLEFPRDDVLPKLAKEYACVLAADELRPHLDREDRGQLNNTQTRRADT